MSCELIVEIDVLMILMNLFVMFDGMRLVIIVFLVMFLGKMIVSW